jgi:ribonuclease-3
MSTNQIKISDEDLEAVEQILDHRFRSRDLLVQALTHSSYSNEKALEAPSVLTNNERLEFLGDAVLGLVVANELMARFPEASEGKLSRWRSNLVSRKTLAEIALQMGIGDYLLLGKGEKRTGGAGKGSILAASLEALVGAMYLDTGLESVNSLLVKLFQRWFDSLQQGDEDFVREMDTKTHLQERTQMLYKSIPQYRLVKSWGPEHEKQFRVEILIKGKLVASGEGKSKKEAEQHAAREALEKLGPEKSDSKADNEGE